MFNENYFQKIISHQEKNDTENDPVLQELTEKIRELAHQENSIGKGMTAEVFTSKTNPNICYKIIHSNGDYNFRNSTYSEGELLAKAEKISRSFGVKIPKPYYSILTKKNDDAEEFEVLVMERLYADSLKDIIEEDLELPINFDFKEFTLKIEKFFIALHDKKIYHRDVHWGNIMIEKETMNPCVIDFGAGTELLLSSEDPYKQTDFDNKMLIFTQDEHRIREALRVKLRGFLFKKYGNTHNL